MSEIKGSQLSPSEKRKVLAAYVHRYTMDHVPQWVRNSEVSYPVQFHSDADWLENTYFKVTLNGNLDRRAKSCMSNPTWPNRPDLRRNEVKS